MNGSFQPGVVDAIASQHVTYEFSEKEKPKGHVPKERNITEILQSHFPYNTNINFYVFCSPWDEKTCVHQLGVISGPT